MPSRASDIASSSSRMVEDPRFDMSKWGKQGRGNGRRSSMVNGAVSSTTRGRVGHDDEGEKEEGVTEEDKDSQEEESDENLVSEDEIARREEEEEEDEDNSFDGNASDHTPRNHPETQIVKPLSEKELAAYEDKQRKRGIIYISRIPHGMTVAKVRHLLGGFGDVERLYLQDGREKEHGQKLTGRRAKSAHFTEGWVEFADKRVAKAVAEMLNAEPIGAASGGSGGGKGGKRAGGRGLRRWKDEVWTMKYLSGFKWYMLSEQLANERASRASRVRAELSQSAFEQKDYLRKVERARVMRDKEARKRARQEKADSATDGKGSPPLIDGKSGQQPGKERSFRQREVITRDVREMQAKRPSDGRDEASGSQANAKYRKIADLGRTRDGSRGSALQGALSKIF